LSWIFGGEIYFSGDPLLALLSGGALLGAFFMATDYVTGPTNKTSKIVFGIGIGALTVLIRIKGGYPEGICYAILLMNPLSTVLDSWFKPKRFASPLAGGAK
jgi:electron transport complex protein RnfD